MTPRVRGSGAQALGEVLALGRIRASACTPSDFSLDPFAWALQQSGVFERAAMAMVERARDVLADLMARLTATAFEGDPMVRQDHYARCEDLYEQFTNLYRPSMDAWFYMPGLWCRAQGRLDRQVVAAGLPRHCPFQLANFAEAPVDFDRLIQLLVSKFERRKQG